MKKIIHFTNLLVLLIACITVLSSCYTTRTEVFTVNDFPKFRQQCIGQTYNQIVTNLGAPQRREPDGQGGNILIYENTTTTSISNSLATAYNVNFFKKTYTPGVATSTQVTNKTDYVQYYVNSDNICYEVKTNIPMNHEEEGNKYKVRSPIKTCFLILGSICGACLVAGGIMSAI